MGFPTLRMGPAHPTLLTVADAGHALALTDEATMAAVEAFLVE